MKPVNTGSLHSRESLRDNLALSRLLIQLINKYLNEENEEKRRKIFAEISELRDISAMLNRRK